MTLSPQLMSSYSPHVSFVESVAGQVCHKNSQQQQQHDGDQKSPTTTTTTDILEISGSLAVQIMRMRGSV